MSSDDLDKIATPRGEARSMQTLPPDMVNNTNAAPGEGADWMGPLQPMMPIVPPQVAGRAFDFMPGYNLSTQPRFGEALDFETLRMLADAYDPIRLILERRKDQMCRLPWKLRLKTDDGKHPTSQQLPPSLRGIIRDATQFFKNPTHDLSFRPWLRMLLDDLLVIDAPTLYCERDRSGTLVALSPIDGGTIKRVIDDHGRTPRPFLWDDGAFEWLGEQVTQENFDRLGFRIVDGLVYAPAYQQVLKGLPAVNYTTPWDLLQKPLNLRTSHPYGMSPVAQIVTTVNIAMRRNMSQLEYYREGNQPESIYGLPETWTPDQVSRFQDYWDNLFVGNLGNRRRMKFLPGGSDSAYTAIKEPPLKSEMDEWLIRIVCFAFSYPPQAFVALSNRSTAEQHSATAEMEGLEPLKNHFADWFSEIIEREFSEDVEFVFEEEDEIDPAEQSKILTRYTDSGVMTRNEARKRLGLSPDPSLAANQLAVKTSTGVVPIDGDVNPADAS